jgi:hypothetical protein
MPNGPTKLIAWRCPNDLLAALDGKAKQDGTSRTAALEAAVRLGLSTRGSVEGELAELKREVRSLRRAVEALSGERR